MHGDPFKASARHPPGNRGQRTKESLGVDIERGPGRGEKMVRDARGDFCMKNRMGCSETTQSPNQ
jgi:hypothetical protein